jgi:hypothetical protein
VSETQKSEDEGCSRSLSSPESGDSERREMAISSSPLRLDGTRRYHSPVNEFGSELFGRREHPSAGNSPSNLQVRTQNSHSHHSIISPMIPPPFTT